MYFKKQHRHKLPYKKFVNFKKNIPQNRRKLLKFKKRKWKNLISYAKRLLKRRKNNFKLYDQNKYFISRNNSFRRKYKYTLEMKKKISLFYGNLTTKYIKQQISVALKTQSFLSNNRINLNSYFIKLFEKRLDSVLYRSHFTLSLRNARQLISHRHVFVNNQIVTNSSYILKTGDLIEINLKIYSLIDDYISRSNLWSFPPKYLQVNYKTLQIVFLDEEKSWNNSMSFPFWVDVRSIVKFYR